jgi:hypothetical protein
LRRVDVAWRWEATGDWLCKHVRDGKRVLKSCLCFRNRRFINPLYYSVFVCADGQKGKPETWLLLWLIIVIVLGIHYQVVCCY